MMPSGYAGLSTRMTTVRAPMRKPKIHRPASVIAAETGSVAMNTMPKAKPPSTRCQYHGIPIIGLSEPSSALSRRLVATIPRKTPRMIR